MLRKTKAIFPTKKQLLKNALIDTITNEADGIEDFFTIVGEKTQGVSTSDRQKVLRQVILDADLWTLLSQKIDFHLNIVLGVETDSIILLDSPNVAPKAKAMIKPFILEYLDSASKVTQAVESLRKLREAIINGEK